MGKSPGARASKGISYSLQRVTKLTKKNSLMINNFIIPYYKKSKKTTSDIDKEFGLFIFKNSKKHPSKL